MNTTEPHSKATQYSASNLLLFIIIIVLFIAFFGLEHDIFYTTQNSGFTFTEAETSSISHGNIKKQRTFFFLFLFSVIILIKRKGHSLIFREFLGWLILANLSWPMISFLWADDPALTGRRIVLFFILNFTAFSIAMNVPLRQLPTIVLWITAPILIIGFFSERVLGTWWFGSPGYRFSGTLHPEGQAINCAILFLAAATMMGKGGRLSRFLIPGVMLLAAVFLVLTKSRGPFVGTIIAFGIYGLCTKKRSTLVAYFYAIIVTFGIMALVFGNALLPLLDSGMNLGRQESVSGLSGRAELWNELGEFVKERPIVGYGFGGFWTENRVLAIADSQRWRIRDSHSIYIDTVLDLGFIGLVIFLTLLIVAWWRARRTCVNGGDEGGAFALSLLTLWMADGLWASLVLGRGFNTLLLFIVLFGITRESQLQRARRVVTNDSCTINHFS